MLAVAVVFCRSAGAVAQLVERDIRIVEVRGSNPLSSTSPFYIAGGSLANRAQGRGEPLQLAHTRRLIRKVPLHHRPESCAVAVGAQVGELMNNDRFKARRWREHESPRERDGAVTRGAPPARRLVTDS